MCGLPASRVPGDDDDLIVLQLIQDLLPVLSDREVALTLPQLLDLGELLPLQEGDEGLQDVSELDNHFLG